MYSDSSLIILLYQFLLHLVFCAYYINVFTKKIKHDKLYSIDFRNCYLK